jgi:hypothetical protein
VFKLDNTRQVEVNRLQIKFPEGSHHVHLYRSSEPEADRVFDCFKGIDWTKWSLVMGAQTQSMDWQLPEGVTIPLEPHQQLLAQVHWLNTTDEPVNEKIDITFHTTEYSTEHLGVLFGVNQRINMAPKQRSRVEHFCQVPDGAKLHAVMGHFHAHGNNYRVTQRMPDQKEGKEIYFAPDEPSFEFKTFLPAHEVPRGAGFEYQCNFFNYDDFPLSWGSDTVTQEHCNMTAYFSPAEKVSELCLNKPSKLNALTPMETSVRAGEDLVFNLELATAQDHDMVVSLSSSNSDALEVPATVTVPKGETNLAFSARTRKPAQVEVTAAYDNARVITPVRVGGLVLSEVFYKPATGATDQMQWIEIANQSNVALDLSSISIGAGVTDFMRTRLGLPMTIPARGCIVVGGPESSPANHMPYFNLTQDLNPDLSLGGDKAAGVALFTTSEMSATARPLDAVVYGGANQQLRGPDGNVAPVWQGSAPGGSIKRLTDGVWSKSSNPTPGVCEVLDAH